LHDLAGEEIKSDNQHMHAHLFEQYYPKRSYNLVIATQKKISMAFSQTCSCLYISKIQTCLNFKFITQWMADSTPICVVIDRDSYIVRTFESRL
jgi:hypothetical protein